VWRARVVWSQRGRWVGLMASGKDRDDVLGALWQRLVGDLSDAEYALVFG